MNTKEKATLTDTVRNILLRNTVIVSEDKIRIRKKGAEGYMLTITVAGDGVSTPFRRNYLKKKLAKISSLAAEINVQKTLRKSGQTAITINFSVAAPALEAAQPVEVERALEAA